MTVPNLPGVPALANPAVDAATIALLTEDAINLLAFSTSPQWGIFQNGEPVIIPDSVIALEKSKEWRISDYPTENGAFQSYDKVETPYDAQVTMAKGGSEADRNAFLTTLEAITETLDLFDVVTPERTYSNANVTRYDYERSARNGATLITARIWLREVRVTATAAYSQTAQPSGSGAINDGTVQAQAPTPAQSGAAAGGTT